MVVDFFRKQIFGNDRDEDESGWGRLVRLGSWVVVELAACCRLRLCRFLDVGQALPVVRRSA